MDLKKPQPPAQYDDPTIGLIDLKTDYLLVNGDINESLLKLIRETIGKRLLVVENLKSTNLILVLTTYGGDADSAFRIGRFFQNNYASFHCFVPSYCKSAGTLIAVASDHLHIGSAGELGPLDVQVRPIDDPIGHRSGLTTNWALKDLQGHALELFQALAYGVANDSEGIVSFPTASDLAARMTSELMRGIYNKIDPERLGQDARNLQIAREYGIRLNNHSKNLKQEGLNKLVNGYPSHEFVIDQTEAKEIFVRVAEPTTEMWNAIDSSLEDAMNVRSADSIVKYLTD